MKGVIRVFRLAAVQNEEIMSNAAKYAVRVGIFSPLFSLLSYLRRGS